MSVLVLAVGILGMGGLQITSLQNSSRSVLRTQAVYFSYEILDRIRANPAAAIAAIQNNGVTFTAPTSNTTCVGASCNASQLFAFDLLEWKCSLGKYAAESVCTNLAATAGSLTNLQAGLPEGDGSISIDANNEYTITIRWRESKDPQTQTADWVSFQLQGVL